MIAEPDCTIWVADGRVAQAGADGALLMQRSVAEREGVRRRGRGARHEPRARRAAGADLRLTGIAEEMGAVLRRAAFSPNIKERADCSAALFTPGGELLVQAEHIPVHLGSMPASVAAAIDALGGDLDPGDQVVLNDPFAGGTHLNDITLVAPCVVDGELVGWAANRAHHADVGGAAPGSIPADATEIQQEGLRIPPTRLDDSVRRAAAGQLADADRADRRPRRPGGRQRGRRRARRRWPVRRRRWPRWSTTASGECGRRCRAAGRHLDAEDVLDSTGAARTSSDRRGRGVGQRMGDEVAFDFTGSDPQARGNVNAVEAVTVSAVSFALRAAVDPVHPGQRRGAAAGAGRGAGGHDRRRAPTGGGRGGQRGGEPAGGRRVPGGIGAGPAGTGCRPRARGR